MALDSFAVTQDTSSRTWYSVTMIGIGALLGFLSVVLNQLSLHWHSSRPVSLLMDSTALMVLIFAIAIASNGLWRIIHSSDNQPGGAEVRRLLLWTSPIAVSSVVVFSALFTLFPFAQTGADRYGECQYLEDAVLQTGLIPTSKVMPKGRAIACGTDRYGIFFSPFSELTIFGLTDPKGQDEVVASLKEASRRERSLSIRVNFFDDENWTMAGGIRGSQIIVRGNQKLLRVAVID